MSHARSPSTGDGSVTAPGPPEAPRVLLLHDVGDDTSAVLAALRSVDPRARPLRAETVPALEAALRARDWDLVIVAGRLDAPWLDAVMSRLAQHDDELPVVVAGRALGDAVVRRAAAAGAHEVVDLEVAGSARDAIVEALQRGGDDDRDIEARVSRTTPHLGTMARLATVLLRASTAHEVLQALAHELGRGLGLPYVETWLLSADGATEVPGPVFEQDASFESLRAAVATTAALGRAGLVRDVTSGRRPRTVHDLRGASGVFRRAPAALALGLNRVHAAPLLVGRRALGAVLAFDHADGGLGDDDVTTIDVAAAHAGASLARLAAEDTVQRERERASDLLDHLADGILACDADGRLTLVNAAMEMLHGGDPGLGTLPADWAERGDLLLQDGLSSMPSSQVPLLRALRGETLDDLQYVIDAPNGRRRVVRGSAQPITDPGGAIRGAVLAVRDVTDRVAAEAATAAAAERTLRTYALLLDDLADLARSVGEAATMAEAWNGVLEFVHHTLGADELVAFRTRPDASPAPLYVAHVVPGVGPVSLDPADAAAGEELERATLGRTVVIEQTLARASVSSDVAREVHSLAAVPMVLGGEVLGGFEVRGYEREAFDESTAVALTMVANLAAIALDHDDLVDDERRARAAAEDAARHFQQIFDASPAAVTISSLRDGRIIDVNPAMETLLGYERDELLGRIGTEADFWPDPQDRALVAEAALRREAVRGAEVRLRRKDGAVRTCLLSADATELHGEPTALVLILDVSDRIAQQERLRKLARFRESLMTFIGETLEVGFDGPFYQRLLESAVGATPNAQAGSLLVRDTSGDTYRFVAAVGYDLGGLQGVTFDDHEIAKAHVDDRAVTSDTLPSTRSDDDRARALRRYGRLDEIRSTLTVPIHVDGQRVASLSLDNFERGDAFDHEAVQLAEAFAAQVATLIKRRALELELEHMAYHDNLTGLPNRVLFRDRLSHAITRALRTQRRGAAIFLDLDNLKLTNDALGHGIGDTLLVGVAERLQASVRAADTVARIGGDEFTMVLPDVGETEDAAGVAEKILRALREPFMLAGHEVHVSASIGITLFPDDAIDADALIQHGDTAMYQAKLHGKDRYRFFTRDMNREILERASLETQLRKALERDELELHYQPRVSLGDGRITSVEALARWHHPERGWISPATFIPVAEEAGLIGAVGRHLLDLACAQAKAWERAGTPAIVAVNFSARQLQERDLVRTVQAALERADLDPRSLEMELTESAIMHNVSENVVKLDQLRALGVSISIDDFGTAYSSLNYLKRLPATALKIDQSFIRDVQDPTDPAAHDAAIIRAIVALASALEVPAIAEGVETTEQLSFLRSVGCEQGQGYLFARPGPPDALDRLLRSGSVSLPSS